MNERKWTGHLAIFTAYFIFGFNVLICNDLTKHPYLSPVAIYLMRTLGAGALFWLISLFTKKEKVAKTDFIKIFFAALLGYFLTQLTFLYAAPLLKPMELAILGSTTPIYTMIVAAIALHEPITGKKVGGVALSFVGVVYLIMSGMSGDISELGSNLWGILLMVGNALFFAMYLGIFRPVIERYSVVTFMKWIFLFSALMGMPFGAVEVVTTDFTDIPTQWLLELAYLVIMATFVAYFLIPYAQKLLRPTLVSMYSYTQPIVTISISIALGIDILTLDKVAATIAVFLGVYIVSRSRAAVRSH